jgi:hypothetical protein
VRIAVICFLSSSPGSYALGASADILGVGLRLLDSCTSVFGNYSVGFVPTDETTALDRVTIVVIL